MEIYGDVTNVVVYDTRLFDINRNVDRWAKSVRRNYVTFARAEAPINKRQNKSHSSGLAVGALKASIKGDVDRIGPVHTQITVTVGVPYALHVIYGTGTIFPKHAKRLRLPFNAGFSPKSASFGHESRFTFVSGQRGNNFLARAHNLTAKRHSSIGKFPGREFGQF